MSFSGSDLALAALVFALAVWGVATSLCAAMG